MAASYSMHHMLERASLAREKAVDILRKIAVGLSFPQDNNVIHRDIKPENIQLS